MELRKTQPGNPIDRLAHRVIGAALEVHRTLGPGFVESAYEESLCIELQLRGITFVRQPVVRVEYKGHVVGEARLDLLVEDELIVELKAVDALMPVHLARLISYLRAMNKNLGLLMNFNVPLLRDGIKRIILT
jgi:GxxExxY protein